MTTGDKKKINRREKDLHRLYQLLDRLDRNEVELILIRSDYKGGGWWIKPYDPHVETNT